MGFDDTFPRVSKFPTLRGTLFCATQGRAAVGDSAQSIYEDESSTAQYIGFLERELSALEREIAKLETRERAEHDKLLDSYWDAKKA